MVNIVLGGILVLVGVFLILVQVAIWLGLVTTRTHLTLAQAGKWDVLLALVEKLPPLFIMGAFLVYCGLKLLGVPLPF